MTAPWLKSILFIRLMHKGRVNHDESPRKGVMQAKAVNDEWGEMSREHFDERCRP